jgi:hypothetical protein
MSKFALLFLLVFLGGIWAAIWQHSAFAFVLYELLYFLNPSARWWGGDIPGVSYSFVASVLMLTILALRYKALSPKSPWMAHPALKWMILVLVSYYFAYLWARVPSDHDKFTFIFTKLVIIVFVAYKLLDSEKALDYAIWGYVVGCAYIGYLATITGRNSGDRLEGLDLPQSGDANGVAAALVPACSILLYLVWVSSRRVKILCVLFGALIANGLVLLNSRGAFLGILSSAGLFALFMIFSRHRQKGQRGLAVAVVIMGISGGLYVTDDLFWERMGTLENLESEESGSGRVKFWLAAVEMTKENPLGMGVSGFNSLASFYLTDKERLGTEFRSVHSLWFQGLTEIGLHGMFFFLLMLWGVYRVSRLARQRVLEAGEQTTYFKVLALECALMGFLVTGTFVNEFRTEILYWMILLVAVAGKIYYLQPLAEEQRQKKKAASESVRTEMKNKNAGSRATNVRNL